MYEYKVVAGKAAVHEIIGETGHGMPQATGRPGFQFPSDL